MYEAQEVVSQAAKTEQDMALKTTVVLLFLLGNTRFSDEDNPKISRFSFFEIFENRRLIGYVSKRFNLPSLLSCGRQCLRNTWCTSVNFKLSSKGKGEGTCELNKHNMSIVNENNNFCDDEGTTLWLLLKTPCSKGPCQNNGTCIPQYMKNSFLCVCENGFEGKECETNINDCEKDSCLNGGTCIDQVNNFKCRCPKDYSGRQCEINLVISINSTILAGNATFLGKLSHFLEPAVGNNSQWMLCHRASTHGWAAATFHTRCDHKSHTVTIIKNGQYVFGGYTDIPWDATSSYGTTSNAFIFSLRNKEELPPFKSMVLQPAYAIYRLSDYGPTFGYGHDIHISDNANSNNGSYADFASDGYYKSPEGVQELTTILAGTQYFSPDDWEVFYLG